MCFGNSTVLIIIKYHMFIKNFLRSKLNRLKGRRGLFKYRDYEEYKRIQIEGNVRKLNKISTSEDNIKIISDYLKKKRSNFEFGICHGTRNGKEIEWFRKYLGIDVIGTEISPTASRFPNTIEWDFHNVKKEWINNIDFIYSNAFDHSYKPIECLDAWMSCVKKDGGLCILEWNESYIDSRALDPFGGTKRDYKKMIEKKYNLVEILKGGKSGIEKNLKTIFFVISHKVK